MRIKALETVKLPFPSPTKKERKKKSENKTVNNIKTLIKYP